MEATLSSRDAINFVCCNADTQIVFYAWRMWWSKTDVYLVARWAPMKGAKISLHGPNEQHAGTFFKYGRNRGADYERSKRLGAVTNAPEFGMEFGGRLAAPGKRHVLTLRWTPGLFKKRKATGPQPDELRVGSLGDIIAAPPRGFYSDIDIYYCQDRPWWRDEVQALFDHARIGPLKNANGEFLTAVSVRRRLRDLPTPEVAKLPTPHSLGDAVRSIGSGVTEDGVLLLLEQWASAKVLTAKQP